MIFFKDILLGGETLKSVLIRLLFFCFCFCLVLRSFYGFRIIIGSSMDPTFSDKEIFITKNFNLDKISINRFDVVIFSDSEDTLVKRVIALPNESIEIKRGHIYLNEKKLKDFVGNAYVGQKLNKDKIIVPEGCLWVIGDNRDDSWYGIIKKKDIKGKVVW